MCTKEPLIAIVDDDESIRDATKGLMRSLGFDAEAFSCGEDFLSSARLGETACLVADINMPGMSGFDLHRSLLASGKNIPTILITAHPSEGIRAEGLGAGVLGYLTKPFAENDLLHYLRSALASFCPCQGKRDL